MIKYLEKLLNGREVEWKKLGEIFNNKTGYTPSKNNKEYWENGTVDWYTIDDINKKGRILTEANIKINEKGVKKGLFESNSIVISVIATIGEYALIKNDFIINQQFLVLSLKNEFKKNINMDFIRCYFSEISQYCKKNIRVGTVPTVDIDNLLNQKIPIPPLDIQEEIVRVLNKFTDHTKELTKELTLRKKEYNYYRDYLLKFEDEVEIVKLGNVVEVYDGTHQTPNYKTEGIPFISVENIADIYNTEKYISEDDYEKNYKITPQIDDVFMTRIGTVGKCAVVTKNSPLAYYVSLALLRPDKNKINSRYLKHIIESQVGKKELNKRILHTAIPIKINKGDIDKLEFPLPSLEIQERIVNVLDNFEKICNDLNIGLPKEIELRQKEYEYYREYILTNIGNRITLEDKTRQDKTRQDKTRQDNII